YARIRCTSRYSAGMSVDTSFAWFCSVHMRSRSEASAACPLESRRENATFVGPKYVRKSWTTSAGAKGNAKSKLRRVHVICLAPLPKRWRTTFSSPHKEGAGIPGGGGTCLAVVLN